MDQANKKIDRRKFLAGSLSCAVGAGMVSLSPALALAQGKGTEKDPPKKELIIRELGKTGLRVPIVGMGVMGSANPAMVQSAYERGIRYFDTAANYQYGRNEQMVGNVIRKMGVRDKVAITTKIMVPAQRRSVQPDQSLSKMESLLDGSLKRLKSDYVDALFIHDVSKAEDVLNPEMIDALQKMRDKKKIKAAGIATHANMAEVINAAVKSKAYQVILTAINFTMADDEVFLNAIANAAANGVGIVAMKVMAGGYNWPNPESRSRYSNSTVTSAALKWVLNNANISTSIPGFANFDELNQDIAIGCNPQYTEEERNLLADNNIRLSMGFCRQCRQCLASCPNNTEIPTLMRVHMYAAQYADFHLARQTFNDIPAGSRLESCQLCDECSATCKNGVDIKNRINTLKQIYC